MTAQTVGRYRKPVPAPTAPRWPWDDRGRSLLTREDIERQYWKADALVRKVMGRAK